jgi:hypothetical protein
MPLGPVQTRMPFCAMTLSRFPPCANPDPTSGRDTLVDGWIWNWHGRHPIRFPVALAGFLLISGRHGTIEMSLVEFQA